MTLPLHWITPLFAAAAGLVFALPAEYRTPAWIGLGVGYLALCGWAAVSLSSPILGRCLNRVDSRDRVALTFDDGPDARCTPAILDLLSERGVTANFFLVGKRVERHPELVRRIHAEGHLVGNHSHGHSPWLTIAPGGPLGADLSRCQESIRRAIGVTPALYRPPYGMRNHATDRAARENGLRVVGWDAGGGDTGGRSADAVVARIERSLGPGSIILLHDHNPEPERAVEVTRRVLDRLAARGLVPARLDELIDGQP